MKIEKVEFENFRIYEKQEFEFNLDKNIIILYGNNGFGKTSFFDGIEWGLTGGLKRYEDGGKEKSDYPFLKRYKADRDAQASVSIKFEGLTEPLKRNLKKNNTGGMASTINKNYKNLSEIMVKEKHSNSVNFENKFVFSHLLSQELISAFIRDTKDTDRYRAFVDLFGLESYGQYDKQIREIKVKIEEKYRAVLEQRDNIGINIEKIKNRLKDIPVDINIIKKKLQAITGNEEININVLKAITEKAEQEITSKNNRVDEIKKEIGEIDYLLENQNSKEKELENLEKVEQEIKKWREELKVLKMYGKLEEIKKSFEGYSKFSQNEDIYKEKKVAYEQHKSLVLDLEKTTDLANKTAYLKLKGTKETLDLLKSFEENIAELQRLELLDIKYESELKEKFGVEKRLIQTAKDFLKENLTLQNCPVCGNKFSIEETLKELEARLHNNASTIFSELSKKISNLRTNILELKKRQNSIEAEISELFNEESDNQKKIRFELENEIHKIDSEEKDYNVVKGILGSLEMNAVDFNAEYNKILKEIEGYEEINPEIVINKIHEQEINIESMKRDTEKYLSIKTKFNMSFNTSEYLTGKTGEHSINHNPKLSKVGSITDILEVRTETAKQIDKIENENSANKKILELAKQIGEFFDNDNNLKELKKVEDDFDINKMEIESLEKVKKGMESLERGIRTAKESELRSKLETYKDEIKKLYSYLNPHLYLKELDIETDHTNKTNDRLYFLVSDSPDNSEKMNPAFTFSTAQNNVLALSIFLSFAIRQDWSKINAVFMDDPIQNMDDINIYSFVDVIRNVAESQDKQFFISTHDERVLNFMEKKFRGNCQVFKFEQYGKIDREEDEVKMESIKS